MCCVLEIFSSKTIQEVHIPMPVSFKLSKLLYRWYRLWLADPAIYDYLPKWMTHAWWLSKQTEAHVCMDGRTLLLVFSPTAFQLGESGLCQISRLGPHFDLFSLGFQECPHRYPMLDLPGRVYKFQMMCVYFVYLYQNGANNGYIELLDSFMSCMLSEHKVLTLVQGHVRLRRAEHYLEAAQNKVWNQYMRGLLQ